MNLGERIYRLRVENNMSQDELAQKINVSRQSISKWENSSAVPDLNKIIMLSEIFHVTIDELVKGKTVENQKEEQFQIEDRSTKYNNGKNWFIFIILILMVAIALRIIIFIISNEAHIIYIEEPIAAYGTLRSFLNSFFDKCVDFAMMIFNLTNVVALVKNDMGKTKKVVLFNANSILGVFGIVTVLSVCFPYPEMNYHSSFFNEYLNMIAFLVISLIVYLIRYLNQRKQKLD